MKRNVTVTVMVMKRGKCERVMAWRLKIMNDGDNIHVVHHSSDVEGERNLLVPVTLLLFIDCVVCVSFFIIISSSSSSSRRRR